MSPTDRIRLEPSMLRLFQEEVLPHLDLLKRRLGDAGSRALEADEVHPLIAACDAIRSAANIVGWPLPADIADQICRAIEDARDGARALSRETTEALERLVTLAARGPSDADEAPIPPKRAGAAPAGSRAEETLLELFRVEVESCAATMSEGLLGLARGPKQTHLDSLMRAAHSIKGAARVVGLDEASTLAHVLEDCFVAAQKGKLALGDEHVDTLLRAVDVFGNMARAPRIAEWVQEHVTDLENARTAVDAIVSANAGTARVHAEAPARQALAAAPVVAEPAPLAVAEPATAERERVVRVSAASIDRLLGLAGESLVEAQRVHAIAASLNRWKRQQAALSEALEEIERARGSDEEHRGTLLAEARARATECRSLAGKHADELDEYARHVEDLSERLYREALKNRMRPLSDGIRSLPRAVRDLARSLGRKVRLEVVGEATAVDRDVLESLESPLLHLLRNAIDHGIEPPEERLRTGKPEEGVVRLVARHQAGMLAITVQDDGRGIDAEKLRAIVVERGLVAEGIAAALTRSELFEFLFLPGFSTASRVTEISGRGVGLDAVRNTLAATGGRVRITSDGGTGTAFHVQLPVTRSVIRAMLVGIAGEAYAFPLLRTDCIARVSLAEISVVEGYSYFVVGDRNVGLVSLRQLFGLGAHEHPPSELCVVVVSDRAQQVGLIVDDLLGERDLVVRPLDPRLGRVQDVSAASILADGCPALILDVDDLVLSVDRLSRTGRVNRVDAHSARALPASRRVLVVDDSITVREVERQLLANRGYAVDVAVDGADGWNMLTAGQYDLVVTDVDMPRMNGIELVQAIRQDARMKATPIIIVSYKDREEDRTRGLHAGANYYVTKSSFHDEKLVEAVEDLIGPPEA